jgi:hypothetical protein
LKKFLAPLPDGRQAVKRFFDDSDKLEYLRFTMVNSFPYVKEIASLACEEFHARSL